MLNFYQQQKAKIIKKQILTDQACLFTFRFEPVKLQQKFVFLPGQFILLGIPGFGEAPFDICSSPLFAPDFFQITIRAVGELTNKLNTLKKNDIVYARGPYGNGFPEFGLKDNLLMIGGGCGVVTFKSFIDNKIAAPDMYGQVQLFYGVEFEKDLYFKNQFDRWRKKISLEIAVNKPTKQWKGYKGLITDLFDQAKIVANPKVLICGPPVMYRFVQKKMEPMKIPYENIYMSLERRMHCGLGVCQHCAVGSKYVCKDGPVFRYDELKHLEKFRM